MCSFSFSCLFSFFSRHHNKVHNCSQCSCTDAFKSHIHYSYILVFVYFITQWWVFVFNKSKTKIKVKYYNTIICTTRPGLKNNSDEAKWRTGKFAMESPFIQKIKFVWNMRCYQICTFVYTITNTRTHFVWCIKKNSFVSFVDTKNHCELNFIRTFVT